MICVYVVKRTLGIINYPQLTVDNESSFCNIYRNIDIFLSFFNSYFFTINYEHHIVRDAHAPVDCQNVILIQLVKKNYICILIFKSGINNINAEFPTKVVDTKFITKNTS